MSGPLFLVSDERTVGNHRYVRVEPASPDTLAADLAPRVRQYYVDEHAARDRLSRAASDLVVFGATAVTLTEEEVDEAVKIELHASLPREWSGDRPRQLDPQRSELGEIVAAEVLSQLFDTRIPASRISHKEIPDQQARGADVMGLEGQPALGSVLVLCEVKTSEDTASPPGVVAGMEAKLRTLTTDRRAMVQELIWMRDHSDGAHASMTSSMCAAFLLKRETFALVLSPVLIRRASTSQETDPGRFETHADSFGHPIRWVSVLLDTSLFDFATDVYRRAGAGAA